MLPSVRVGCYGKEGRCCDMLLLSHPVVGADRVATSLPLHARLPHSALPPSLSTIRLAPVHSSTPLPAPWQDDAGASQYRPRGVPLPHPLNLPPPAVLFSVTACSEMRKLHSTPLPPYPHRLPTCTLSAHLLFHCLSVLQQDEGAAQHRPRGYRPRAPGLLQLQAARAGGCFRLKRFKGLEAGAVGGREAWR